MAKELSALEQVLVDTIKKSTEVGGEIYTASKDAIAKGVDFAQQQIPDVIHQLLMWELTQAIVWLIVSVVLFVIAYKSLTDKWLEWSDGATVISATVAGIVGVVVFLHNLLLMLKILIAPKLFLIQYATDLVKSVT